MTKSLQISLTVEVQVPDDAGPHSDIVSDRINGTCEKITDGLKTVGLDWELINVCLVDEDPLVDPELVAE